MREITRETLVEERIIGTQVNGKPINNIRFADNTILIAKILENLQTLVTQVIRVIKEEEERRANS